MQLDMGVVVPTKLALVIDRCEIGTWGAGSRDLETCPQRYHEELEGLAREGF